MGFSQVGHKGSAVLVPLITTDIAGGHMSLISQALGKGLEAQHQIVDQMAVLLGKAQEHN
jgi:hydroxymethylglutaryl-CoA reductase